MVDENLIWASVILIGIGIVCLTALAMWRGWLDLKRGERAPRPDVERSAELSPALRIEMANLKERLRKLEAIATGVDL